MAVTPAALISPTGELDPAILFPGESTSVFTARLTAYLAQGATEAAGLSGAALDAAVTNWAYYRAYDAVAQRLAAEPVSQSLSDQGSVTYGGNQARTFRALADAKLAAFTAAVAPDTIGLPDQVSTTKPTVFTW